MNRSACAERNLSAGCPFLARGVYPDPVGARVGIFSSLLSAFYFLLSDF